MSLFEHLRKLWEQAVKMSEKTPTLFDSLWKQAVERDTELLYEIDLLRSTGLLGSDMVQGAKMAHQCRQLGIAFDEDITEVAQRHRMHRPRRCPCGDPYCDGSHGT